MSTSCKTLVVLGAGPGLGAAVAQRFGREGYSVALVARRLEPLEELSATLARDGITAAPFQADLGRAENVPPLLEAIRKRFGRIDAIYYSPAGTEAFLPASEMTAEMVRDRSELLFVSLVAAVNGVLPEMRQRGDGAVLAGFGGSAMQGLPFMSGPAPAQAAARNYLYSLNGEVAGDGIRVGMVTISAVITGSAYHRAVEAKEDDTPGGFEMPVVEGQDLAEALWQAAVGKGQLEATFPPG